jgi:uncharacterized membrane protein
VRKPRNHAAVTWVAVAALLFVAGTYAAPMQLLYAPLCHQQEARSFAVGDGHQAVCSRCSGLYWGGVAGLFAAIWFFSGGRREPRPLWLLIVAIPTLVDAAAHWIGLPSLPLLPRCIIALPLGFVAGLFLADAVGDLRMMIQEKRTLLEERHG